jgi:spore germination cell wall hydrolase CwlJ-like protein
MAEDRAIAAYTVFCEASSENHDARLGVAYCIMNRAALAPHFGETIADVCLKWEQFSSWNGDPGSRNNLRRAAQASDDDPVFVDCGQAVDQAEFKSVPDPTHGATHYFDTSIQPPDWTDGAIRTVQLGRLIFYRGVR